MKVAFLTNIISPYRCPVFKTLGQTPDWDFRVMVNASCEFDRSWSVDTSGVNVTQTKTFSIPRRVHCSEPVDFQQVITLHLPTGLWGDLKRFKPDVVISHELGPRSIVAAAYCRRHRIPLVLWAYQSRVSATQGSVIRQVVRKKLLKQANVVVGMGQQAREVLQQWGVVDSKIMNALNATDHQSLHRRQNEPIASGRVESIRAKLGKNKKIAAVFGRLVPLKGTHAMIETWKQLPKSLRAQWQLVFVGQGPLESLVRHAKDFGVVHIPNVAFGEMADWYNACDLHVFPTLGDVWGLVVNEAMVCAKPTLCSIHAGCFDDLICPLENGFAYDPASPQCLVQLEAALTHPDLPALGKAAQQTIAPYTIERLALSFQEAVKQAMTQFPSSATHHGSVDG